MTRDWVREIAESTQALKAALGIRKRGPWLGQGANAHAAWQEWCEETPQLWASWIADWWRRKTGGRLPETPPPTEVEARDAVRDCMACCCRTASPWQVMPVKPSHSRG